VESAQIQAPPGVQAQAVTAPARNWLGALLARGFRALVAQGLQASLSIGVFLLASVTALVLWLVASPVIDHPVAIALLAASVPLAAHVSLRIRGGVRLYFTGASLLFIVALLSPVLAMAVMGAGMGAKELSVCRRCQNHAWQVLGQTGRWMLLALGASTVVHLTNVFAASALIGIVLWLGDVLSAPLVLRTKSRLMSLYRRLLGATWQDELMQYFTGALLVPVVLVARDNMILLLPSLAALAIWLFLYYLLHPQTQREG
jgi:hypothetical protein